jgi:hypothetical protein
LTRAIESPIYEFWVFLFVSGSGFAFIDPANANVVENIVSVNDLFGFPAPSPMRTVEHWERLTVLGLVFDFAIWILHLHPKVYRILQCEYIVRKLGKLVQRHASILKAYLEIAISIRLASQ